MAKDEIYDPLRRKNVRRTPEEEVRQSVIVWLNSGLGTPMTLMASEYGFTYNGRQYRADIVVFDRSLNPLLLVECKAPSVAIDRSVIEQAMRYNRVLSVKYILVTNGNTSYLCNRDAASGEFRFTAEVPKYEEMLQK